MNISSMFAAVVALASLMMPVVSAYGDRQPSYPSGSGGPVSRYDPLKKMYQPVKCSAIRGHASGYTCYRLFIRSIPATSKFYSPNNETILTTRAVAGDIIDVPTGLKAGVWETLSTVTGVFDPITREYTVPQPGEQGLEATRLNTLHYEIGPTLGNSLFFQVSSNHELLPDGTVGPSKDMDVAITGGTGAFLGAVGEGLHAGSVFDKDPTHPEGYVSIWVPQLPRMVRYPVMTCELPYISGPA